MKKLMIAAAVMAAGVAMADGIVSSEVVGYMNKSLDNGDFNWTCPSFKMVGGETMTLGDLKVNENYFASVLQFTDAGGATKKFTLPLKGEDPNLNPTGEEVEGFFEYWALDWFDGETIVNADGYAAGWYLRDSNDKLYLMDALQIPTGKGVMIDCGDDDAALVFAGAVNKQDTPVDLDNGDFNWTGNCSPSDITLADLTVNENYFASVLQFTDAGGATKKFTLPLKGEDPNTNPSGEVVYGEFEYWDAEWFDGETIVNADGYAAGWYLRDSQDNLYLMDALKIPAGSGFMIDCGDDDAQVIIPSAL